MAFIPVPDCAELVATWTLPNGNVAKNVMNFRETSLLDWPPEQLNLLIDGFLSWENATAKALRSNQVTLTNVLARRLGEQDSWVVERSASIVGTVAVPVLPANVTFAVKSLTGLAGRSNRGRSYWIGLAESSVSGDFVLTNVGNSILAAYNTLRSLMLGTYGFNTVVVSRYHNNAPRTVAVANDVTTWAITDYRVDTQRRRLIGEGQ